MEPAISQRVLIGIVTGGRIKRNAVDRLGIDIDNLFSFVAIHTQYRVVVGIVDRFDGGPQNHSGTNHASAGYGNCSDRYQ